MNNIKFKKLDMSQDIDQKILLKYFFKKENTILKTNELLSMSSIAYNSKQKNIFAVTNRFKKELEPFINKQFISEDVDDTLKSILADTLKIQEELVRCEIQTDTGSDYFYVTVIGVDFFMIESEVRK